jgi:hypothetical protein
VQLGGHVETHRRSEIASAARVAIVTKWQIASPEIAG